MRQKPALDIEPKLSCFYDPKVVTIHGWIDSVISSLLPFTIVEQSSFRKHTRYKSIDYKKFMKYLSLLTKRVEFKIRQRFPDLFSLIFDGWSESDTHIIAIFAGVSANNESGYKTYLLGFSPFESEASQNAEEHKPYAEFVLNSFGKSWNNVAALCGDNCNTNKAFATLVNKPLVWCYSHRFNLAAKDLLETHKTLIAKV